MKNNDLLMKNIDNLPKNSDGLLKNADRLMKNINPFPAGLYALCLLLVPASAAGATGITGAAGTAGATARSLAASTGEVMDRAVQRIQDTRRLTPDGARTAMERVTVTGQAGQAHKIPGSADYIGEVALEKFKYDDIQRILRQIPGINIQEEDGFGLRPNIGLRGTGVERSSKITLMEDGILIAPAPYAAPAAYYFPRVSKFEAIEVRKGSSAIKFGPYTTGGAINMITRPVPDEPLGFVDTRAGENGLRQLHAYGAIGTPTVGALAEVSLEQSNGFKKLDGGGNTGFTIEDYLGKIRFASAPNARRYQELELKAGHTDETSNETYLGLTDEDFAATPFRRYRGSQRDVLTTEHELYQARHFIRLSPVFDVTTTAYRTQFKRNWFKLDKVAGTKISALLAHPQDNARALAITKGADTGAGETLDVKANNRSYYAWGLQTIIGANFAVSGAQHDLEVSARYHKDQVDRFQWVDRFAMSGGEMLLQSAGVPGTDSNRISNARAWAFYIQDTITLGDVTVVPGLRYETIDLERRDYGKTDPGRRGDALKIRKNTVNVLIPGIGATWQATPTLQLLAGVHKGFTPPGPGNAASKEERSVNYEAGARYDRRNLKLEAIGFYNDYANLIGLCTASSGADCEIGDQFDAGKVRVWGLEALATHDFGHDFSRAVATGLSIPLRLAYTFTDTAFRSSFASAFWGPVTRGDALPYIPRHQIFASLGVETARWGMSLAVNYVAAVRTVAGQGAAPNGETVGAHTVADLSAHVMLTPTVRLYGTVENLFDNIYAVARRPAGLRPGKPRTAKLGLSAAF